MPAAINPIYPVVGIASVDDLMGIAVAMEGEAALRYGELAVAMERADEPALATLFRRLAALEREHESGLGRWAEREGRGRPVPAHFQWQMPETFGTAADGAAAHTLTPYGALAIAVSNEERAFSFYAYLAAIAESDEIRRRAEALAREELNHVRELRAMRRAAFHAAPPPPRAPRPPEDSVQLAQLVCRLEAASAVLDEAVARRLAAAGWQDGAAELGRQAALARDRARRFGQSDPGAQPEDLSALGPADALRRSLRNAEQVAETYLAAAGESTDEDVLNAAQILAGEAVARLAAVSALMERQDGRKP